MASSRLDCGLLKYVRIAELEMKMKSKLYIQFCRLSTCIAVSKCHQGTLDVFIWLGLNLNVNVQKFYLNFIVQKQQTSKMSFYVKNEL